MLACVLGSYSVIKLRDWAIQIHGIAGFHGARQAWSCGGSQCLGNDMSCVTALLEIHDNFIIRGLQDLSGLYLKNLF